MPVRYREPARDIGTGVRYRAALSTDDIVRMFVIVGEARNRAVVQKMPKKLEEHASFLVVTWSRKTSLPASRESRPDKRAQLTFLVCRVHPSATAPFL